MKVTEGKNEDNCGMLDINITYHKIWIGQRDGRRMSADSEQVIISIFNFHKLKLSLSQKFSDVTLNKRSL